MNITISPSIIQQGKEPVRIEARELGAKEVLKVKVTNPHKQEFTMFMLADEFGQADSMLYLVDGVGTYVFEAAKEHCEEPCNPFLINVLVQPCKVEEVSKKLPVS